MKEDVENTTNHENASQQNETNHLIATHFVEYRKLLTDIVIAPFDPQKAKGVGYNFSLSEMIYSITRNNLVPICRDAHETYFYLHPHETVLALSYEYIKVDKCIAGSFHSRVRMTAQGIGSISTTLDPGWKGMLLFSLNNPTRKRLKIVLSKRSDGVVEMQSVLTLVAWKAPIKESDNKAGEGDGFTLRLDNPPMRIDIWSELAAKPLRLFRNRGYQRFCRLVESLSPFNSAPSQAVDWALSLKELLTELRIAIDVNESESDIRSALIRINSFMYIPTDVRNRLTTLTKVLDSDIILCVCKANEYTEAIDLADREIEYQLLCDQIAQIHELITKHVPTSWHKNILANVWQQFKKNIGVFLATIVSVILVIYGHHTTDTSYWTEILVALVPLIVSIVFNLVTTHKE